MRVVFDANVLISALLSPSGVPAELVRRWRSGVFQLLVSDHLLDEFATTLQRYPKLERRIPSSEIESLLVELRPGAELAADVDVAMLRSTDPDDDYLIGLAESQDAILVSGDQHLLALAERFPIDSPRSFLERLDSLT